jgi:hypothetical protein
MSRRILCRWHDDRRPSMYLFPNGGFCFVCGKSATLAELGNPEPPTEEELLPEDLARSFAYIDSLALRQWRGLTLPLDDDSAYLVWPDRTYYKRRLLHNEKVRYLSPLGHRKPWFWARREGDTLIVIEGELNCLSVAEATPYACVSPGGAGDFSSTQAKKNLPSIIQYDTILVVADADAAGAKAVIDLYGELAGRGKTAKTLLMPTDANEVLQQRGKEELRQEIERGLGAALEEGA